jgi:hypothetical protein
MFFTLAHSPFKAAIKVALAQQIPILLLSSCILDGGDIFMICLIPFFAFWVGVCLIRSRRPLTPTKFDLFLIQWSYAPLCLISFWLVHWFWKVRGIRGFS